MLNRHFRYSIILFMAVVSLANAQQLRREDWGAPTVSVTHADGKWVIAGNKNKVTLNEANLALTIQTPSANWQMVPSTAKDMLVRARGEDAYLQLSNAEKITITPYDTGFKTGVKISLSG